MDDPHSGNGDRQLKVLILEDLVNDAATMARALHGKGLKFDLKRVENRKEFVDEISSYPWDVILANFNLPGCDPEEALAILKENRSQIPLIVVAETVEEGRMGECLRKGAYDYVSKADVQRLASTVANAVSGNENRRLSDRLATALESTADLAAILEPDGRIYYMNRGGQLLFGLEEGERVESLNFMDFYPEPSRSKITGQALPTCLKVGIWSGETKMRRRDGVEITVSQVITAHRSMRAGKELVDFLSTYVRNISEDKKIEEKVRIQEKQYRELADLFPGSVFEIGETGKIDFANQKALKTFGYDRQELRRGVNIAELITSKDRDRFVENFQQRKRKEKTSPSDFLARKKDGATFPIRVFSSPIVSELGPIGLREIMLDMTSSLEAEERMREQAALIDIVPSALLSVDMDGRVIFWSKGAEALYKWKAHDVIGKKFSELFRDTLKAEIEAKMALVIAGGKWDGEVKRSTKEGQEVIVETHWVLIRDTGGRPKSILISNSDVTEKSILHKQYMRSQRIESVGILSSKFAHDMNSVLSPILLSIQFLKQRTTDEKSLFMLRQLQESTLRGADIIKQIVSFAGDVLEERVPINLRQIVSEVVSLLMRTKPGDVRIKVSITDDLPSFYGDQGQLYQAVMNLCVNALEAMPMGGDLTITAGFAETDTNQARMQAGAPPGRYTLLEVKDTGIGIPEDILPKIFDPFFTTKEMPEKLGLGLSTAAIVVKNHGGFIEVLSKAGSGTTFLVYFPAVKPEQKSAGQRDQGEFPKGNGETVLVVDDEMSVVEMTRNTLELYDYNVLTAANGARALSVFGENEEKIRAVILDLTMPVMDGKAALEALREISPSLKVIIVTGSTQTPEEQLLLDANAYLKKPFNTRVLLNVLSDVLKT